VRIAIIGAGIAGLGAAYLLQRRHQITIFEAQARVGGHTHTHSVVQNGKAYEVDSGFIVFNPGNYPLLTRLFAELGVESQPTTMSFSVKNELTGLEYNATNLNAMFCQRRNLFRPAFLGMVREILRFYREAPALLNSPDPGPTIGQYLQAHRYGPLFISDHLIPMASALWSSPPEQVSEFPAKYLVQFMANHQMLDASNRPEWRVVKGGSSRYLDKLIPAIRAQIHLDSRVTQVLREPDRVRLQTATGEEYFDQVIFACHSDQALGMIGDSSDAERDLLGAISFQRNDTVLHTDASLLPRNPKAWAAWNVLRMREDSRAATDPACTVSYCMNLLQAFSSEKPFIVSLNATARIDPKQIIARMDYAHPVYTHVAVAAQQRWHEINGVNRSWYCGAWWGWGFHEDGLRSGVRVAEALGASWD